LLLAAGLAGIVRTVEAAPVDPPLNFVLILVDDLGWTDLGCMGSGFYETPNIDRLADEGVRFTDAYSACTVCSPTRAAVLTGKSPARLHLTDWIEGHKRPKARLRVPDWTLHLRHEEVTIPELLKHADYVSASIGKWHLGGEEHGPTTHGFDRNVAGYHRGQPPSYFSPYRIPTLEDGPEGEYLTDRECGEALKFIEENRDRPFFLYLTHYAVHTPLQATEEFIDKYEAKDAGDQPHGNPVYAAMIESVDRSVGRLVSKLDELGISERTVILFTSDNGGLIGNSQRLVTSNKPLRAGKGSAYEGGVRVPLIIKWPGVVVGGTVSAEPVISMDFLPTLAAMAGVEGEVPGPLDGRSLVPLLNQSGDLDRDALYWHYPHYHPGGATPHGAMRMGDFKLIEFYEDGRRELYNLEHDAGETKDLSSLLPDKAAQMAAQLNAWRKAVGAQMPTPNPDHDPER
jgi:arylsulfatase A-like enzyme